MIKFYANAELHVELSGEVVAASCCQFSLVILKGLIGFEVRRTRVTSTTFTTESRKFYSMKSLLVIYMGLLCLNIEVQSDPYGVIFKIRELAELESKLVRKVRTFIDKRLKTIYEDQIPPEAVV